MAAFKLLGRLVVYYALLGGAIWLALTLEPQLREYLPIGRVQMLIADGPSSGNLMPSGARDVIQHSSGPLGPSLIWLIAAIGGALAASLPVSWIYMSCRNPHDYDQSLIDTIVVLPLVVTAIVVVVQHSLALSFSLAGIAGAARFRNSLKSSGDLLFILLAIGIGLSAGIGALELALVSSAMFCLTFILLWTTNYGERAEMKRFLGEFEHPGHAHPATTVTATTAVLTEVTETFEKRPKEPDCDDDD